MPTTPMACLTNMCVHARKHKLGLCRMHRDRCRRAHAHLGTKRIPLSTTQQPCVTRTPTGFQAHTQVGTSTPSSMQTASLTVHMCDCKDSTATAGYSLGRHVQHRMTSYTQHPHTIQGTTTSNPRHAARAAAISLQSEGYNQRQLSFNERRLSKQVAPHCVSSNSIQC